MKKMKKAALIFGTGLCLAVGTGGTLAYLGDTGQVANRLTFAGEKGAGMQCLQSRHGIHRKDYLLFRVLSLQRILR